MDNDKEVMEIIAYAGDARAKFLESILSAKDAKYEESKRLFHQGEQSLILADTLNARLFECSVSDAVSLLVVHSQDYLMNASTLKELASIMNAFLEEKAYD